MLKKIYDKDYLRVASCVPGVRPGDIDHNTAQIREMMGKAFSDGARIALFPELCITGYTCGDLFAQELLIEKGMHSLKELAAMTAHGNHYAIVGLPWRIEGRLYNCAAMIGEGEILGIVAKRHLPNYGEFYEKRWFASGDHFSPQIFEIKINDTLTIKAGIEICEDLWVPQPPSGALCQMGADVIFNLSASDENIGKHHYLIDLIKSQSARCRCGYVYSSAGFGESSTDLAFCGNAIIAEQGRVLAEGDRFSLRSQYIVADIDIDQIRNDRIKYSTFHDPATEHGHYPSDNSPRQQHCHLSHIQQDAEPTEKEALSEVRLMRDVDPMPFVDQDKASLEKRCREITDIQAWGLMQRLHAIRCDKAVIGISGGLDSTLALLITVKAFDRLGFDRKNITAVTMPGPGTTRRTHSNADTLMESLGVTIREISIGKAVMQHFEDIGHDATVTDATYENSQARERTQILMDIANQTGGIVIGTGDLSELALGWCTYNGDQMSMYGVNASVPKTLVKHLVRWFAESSDRNLRDTLLDIIDTPISPELKPADKEGNIEQKTEDLVGPYELHDFFLYHMLRHAERPSKIFSLATQAFDNDYSPETILKWIRVFYRRFFTQQFKRSAMPDGVKVGSVCLSPRGDWRMPSDASVSLWLDDLDGLENAEVFSKATKAN